MSHPCKLFTLVALLSAATVSLGFIQPAKPTAPAKPTQPTAPAKPGAPDMDDHMKAMMAAAAPGPIHAKLAKLAGNWDESTSFQMPGGEPQKTTGSLTIKSELGGRFLHESGSGVAMGAPTQSFKVWGYNNGSKKFEGVWTWTNSTGLLYVSGESNDNCKTIDWKAWYDDDAGKRQEFKINVEFTDDDHITWHIHDGKMPDGSPGPTMTTVYTRKK